MLFYDFDLPAYETNYKSLEAYDEFGFAEFFVRLLDEAEVTNDEWKSFEETVGKIHWNLILNNVNEECDDGDINPWKTSNNYAVAARTCGEAIHILRAFFRGWIVDINESLDNVSRISFFDFLSNENSFYLSFNYTNTLEKIYSIKKCLSYSWRYQ